MRAGAFPVCGREQQAKSGISPIPSLIAASARISAALEIAAGPAQGSELPGCRWYRAGIKRAQLTGLAPLGGARTPGMLLGSSEGAWERESLGGAMPEGTDSPEPPLHGLWKVFAPIAPTNPRCTPKTISVMGG